MSLLHSRLISLSLESSQTTSHLLKQPILSLLSDPFSSLRLTIYINPRSKDEFFPTNQLHTSSLFLSVMIYSCSNYNHFSLLNYSSLSLSQTKAKILSLHPNCSTTLLFSLQLDVFALIATSSILLIGVPVVFVSPDGWSSNKNVLFSGTSLWIGLVFLDAEVEMEDVGEEELLLDIDSGDKNNTLAVVDYVDDLYSHYRRVESSSCVPPNYMIHQADINERMRGILIDWLIEVHYKFELMEETLYLTVNLIDRFIAVHPIVRKKLQLVGITAMLLACKYEEVSVPVVDDLIMISDKASPEHLLSEGS